MRMAEDAHFGLNTFEKSAALFRQLLPAFVKDVSNGNATAGQHDHCLGREPAPLVVIDIAGHRRYGSNGSKLLDDQLSTDIAGAERKSLKERLPSPSEPQSGRKPMKKPV